MVCVQASPEARLTVRRVSSGPDFEVEYLPRKDGKPHEVRFDYLGTFEASACVPQTDGRTIQGSGVEFENWPESHSLKIIDEDNDLSAEEDSRLQLFPWSDPYEIKFGPDQAYYLEVASVLP